MGSAGGIKLNKAADGETVGLIVVILWVNVGTVEVQVPRFGRGISPGTPEVAVRTSIHGSASSAIDVP